MTNDQNYILLRGVLDRAYEQAAGGKGAQRHAQGQPFEKQPMQKLIDLYGVGFALGQAGKKAQESQRMEHEPAVRELLGAINYLAGAVIALEMREKEKAVDKIFDGAEYVVDGVRYKNVPFSHENPMGTEVVGPA